MEFSKLILTRESCRNFSAEPVDEAALVRCIEAARLAPSACNSQPWYFVAVTQPELRNKLGALCRMYGGNAYAQQAGALVAVFEVGHPILNPNVDRDFGCKAFAQGDVGMATACLTLAAADEGLASCIMGTFIDEKVKELLGMPEDCTCRAVVAVGHAAEKSAPRPKTRKPLEEITRFVK
ncbi:MAG TPA: nitroreductase family protein [Terriglobales bacterium]|nr:nitroreductase family protein [Terriglobales bacterium]